MVPEQKVNDYTPGETKGNSKKALPQVDAGKLSQEAGLLRWIILAGAVLFVFLGLFRNEAAAVFRKAATICLECIGIG